MRYGSVCSGIEAASVAWEPLGWTPAFFSEIEAFPSAVLAHRYPHVPNLGDMTNFKEWPDAAIDVLVGGTPCQSFSVAGLRKGLADPRGNLALTYLGIVERFGPRWVVWENVPGVRSSDGGRAFGSFLGALGELGYGWAYRSLDAQYAGLAQRRERVFVVGYLGDWRRAAEVLFERESLSWDTPACVAARQEAAKRASGPARGGRLWRQIAEAFGANRAVESFASNAEGGCRDGLPFLTASNLGKTVNNQTPLVTAPVGTRMYADRGDTDAGESHLVAHSLRAEGFDASHANAGGQVAVASSLAVRRLMPVECERLQGFPDDWTQIPWRGKPAELCPDGPRYKAIGNSMPVDVMRWVGERIDLIDGIGIDMIEAAE